MSVSVLVLIWPGWTFASLSSHRWPIENIAISFFFSESRFFDNFIEKKSNNTLGITPLSLWMSRTAYNQIFEFLPQNTQHNALLPAIILIALNHHKDTNNRQSSKALYKARHVNIMAKSPNNVESQYNTTDSGWLGMVGLHNMTRLAKFSQLV